MKPPPSEKHKYTPDVSFDGGNLDCGNGLLLMLRKHLDALAPGGLLEILSTERSVEEDLPAWCRLTSNDLVSWTRQDGQLSFLVCKGTFSPERIAQESKPPPKVVTTPSAVPVTKLDIMPAPGAAPEIAPLAVTGIGSWPRPRWLIRALHEHLEGRMTDEEFHQAANDAVRLSVSAQLRAGVDVVTDGEQRRDSYASFVGNILDNCQLIPLTDLLPLVDDPAKFQAEMQSLDVPADKVRHPAIFGPLGRSRSLALPEFEFARTLTAKPVKVALPGPYLLTRTMWMECITDKVYQSREQLAEDIVRVLREEAFSLLAAGVALVQFDEPVLTEVVFGGPKNSRSFMCGALSERGDAKGELSFAVDLANRLIEGMPRSRTAMHVCRGNWSPDESVALRGDYHPLLPALQEVKVGTLFLEYCTPRAGDLEVIKELPRDVRVGIGVVNPKSPEVESLNDVIARAESAINMIGAERILLNPDCGFATFADNPVASAEVAEQKLKVIAEAAAFIKGSRI